MERIKALGTPVIIVLVLIASALLTVTLPIARDAIANAFSGGGSEAVVNVEPEGPEEVVLDVDGYLLGEELVKIPFLQEVNGTETNSLVVFGALAAVVIGGMVGLTLLIGAIVVLGDRSARQVKEDEAYQQAVSQIEQKEKAFVKERMETQPPTPKPSGIMPRWSAISTGMIIIILAYFLGVVIGAGFGMEGNGLGLMAAIVAAVIVLWRIRPEPVEPAAVSDVGDAAFAIPWGAIWVVVWGAIMIGLGIGAMVAVMSGNDPFTIFTGEWWITNVWTPLTT